MPHPRAEHPHHCTLYPSASPDVLDIVIMSDLVFPVHLTTCSALSSNHLPILIDTQCRSSFLSPPDRPDLRTDWPKFQACLETGLPPNPDLPNEGLPTRVSKTDKRFLQSAGRFHSQVSPTCCPTAPITE